MCGRDPDLWDQSGICRYRMDHDPGRHDDRAVALALAAHHLVSRVPRRRIEMGLVT